MSDLPRWTTILETLWKCRKCGYDKYGIGYQCDLTDFYATNRAVKAGHIGVVLEREEGLLVTCSRCGYSKRYLPINAGEGDG